MHLVALSFLLSLLLLLLCVPSPAVCGGDGGRVQFLGHMLRQYQEEMQLLRGDVETLQQLWAGMQQQQQQQQHTSPSPTAPAEGRQQTPWLLVGVPTVPRQGAEYLTRTLQSMALHLPSDHIHPLFGSVVVFVFNNRPGGHDSFEALRATYRDNPAFVFEENASRFPGASDAHEEAFDPGSPNVPGSKVRDQTRDIASLMEVAVKRFKARYFMLLEDDMNFCPGTLQGLMYVVDKVERAVGQEFSAIRVSYGMNGAILQWRDVPVLAKYMRDNLHRRPPDHLLVEWYVQETPRSRKELQGRPLFSFRYSMFFHSGTKSSLRDSPQAAFPGCFHELGPPILFDGEAFQKSQCPQEDLSPCDKFSSRGLRLKFQPLEGPPPISEKE